MYVVRWPGVAGERSWWVGPQRSMHDVDSLGRSARVCTSPACAASNDCFFTSFRARAASPRIGRVRAA
eukprot:scaffold21205_cov107-Phaeocystis_antarctica.AAC.2